jgi:Tol biopolymer transport system component
MTNRRSIVLSDELLRLALVGEPAVGLADAVTDALESIVRATPQQRPLRVPWPWTPTLPGLPSSAAQRRLRFVAVVVAVAMLLSLGVGLAALAGAFHRLPPPYGIARPGLIALDSDGDIVVARADGTGQRPLTSGPAFDVHPTFSPNGARLAFWSSTRADRVDLMMADPNAGTVRTLLKDVPTQSRTFDLAYSSLYGWPTIAWSPDSARIAYTAMIEGQNQIFVVDVERSTTTPIGDPALVGRDPAWSPDGRTIAFAGGRADDDRGIYVMAADGSAPRRLTTAHYANFHSPSWSPDGRRIAFDTDGVRRFEMDKNGWGWSSHVVDAISGAESEVFDAAALSGGTASVTFSPDGSRLAYLSLNQPASPSPADPPATPTIVVAGADGEDPTVVMDGNEAGPTEMVSGVQWSPDGRHLLVGFVDTTRGVADRMLIVAIDRTPGGSIVGHSIDSAAWQRLAP